MSEEKNNDGFSSGSDSGSGSGSDSESENENVKVEEIELKSNVLEIDNQPKKTEIDNQPKKTEIRDDTLDIKHFSKPSDIDMIKTADKTIPSKKIPTTVIKNKHKKKSSKKRSSKKRSRKTDSSGESDGGLSKGDELSEVVGKNNEFGGKKKRKKYNLTKVYIGFSTPKKCNIESFSGFEMIHSGEQSTAPIGTPDKLNKQNKCIVYFKPMNCYLLAIISQSKVYIPRTDSIYYERLTSETDTRVIEHNETKVKLSHKDYREAQMEFVNKIKPKFIVKDKDEWDIILKREFKISKSKNPVESKKFTSKESNVGDTEIVIKHSTGKILKIKLDKEFRYENLREKKTLLEWVLIKNHGTKTPYGEELTGFQALSFKPLNYD